MAVRESDREELLREATALVERVELTIPGCQESIVVGFRRDGAASFFFGPDPVYQFNAAGELRRAYVNGLLYKAERGRLVALRRDRSATEIALVRTELQDSEATAFLASLHERLAELHAALVATSYQRIGQVPAGVDLFARISRWLDLQPPISKIADAPHSSHR
jgi:phytoene dehydrogenase-like protein